MQQETKSEPYHYWFVPSKKSIAAIIAASAIILGFSSAAMAEPSTTYNSRKAADISHSVASYDSIFEPTILDKSSASVVIISAEPVEEVPPPPPPPPPGYALLEAARTQIGWAQDCTALVENALRSLGYSVGDLAPMSFGGYGYQVSPDSVQPGDIMMRDGHVAIYAGDGVAIHGGFNGMTVESSIDASPYGYAVIIRL